jgi:hypothetical protein
VDWRAAKKFEEKLQKKACQPLAFPLDGKFTRQTARFCRSKKNQKIEKKACQGIRNSISLPKPNQTNGETND